jgi:hypothetical protein
MNLEFLEKRLADLNQLADIGVAAEEQSSSSRALSLVVDRLRAEGVQRIWLVAPADPALRAFGFYRALGWQPTAEQLESGNEVLELP